MDLADKAPPRPRRREPRCPSRSVADVAAAADVFFSRTASVKPTSPLGEPSPAIRSISRRYGPW